MSLIIANAQAQNRQLLVQATFLPYLKFFYGTSELCKQKKFPSDTFGLVRPGSDTPEQLGEAVDVLFLATRAHALDLSGKDPVHNYDMDSDTYKSIRERADLGGYNSNCMYGPEFLVYLPGQNTLANFHLGNKSLRFLGSRILDLLPVSGQPIKGARLKTKWVEKAKVPFMGVEVENNNAIVIGDPEAVMASIEAEMPRFLNPQSTGAAAEKAPAADERG